MNMAQKQHTLWGKISLRPKRKMGNVLNFPTPLTMIVLFNTHINTYTSPTHVCCVVLCVCECAYVCVFFLSLAELVRHLRIRVGECGALGQIRCEGEVASPRGSVDMKETGWC